MSIIKDLVTTLQEKRNKEFKKIKKEAEEKEAAVWEEYRKLLITVQSTCAHTSKRDETWEHPHSGSTFGSFVCNDCGKEF